MHRLNRLWIGLPVALFLFFMLVPVYVGYQNGSPPRTWNEGMIGAYESFVINNFIVVGFGSLTIIALSRRWMKWRAHRRDLADKPSN